MSERDPACTVVIVAWNGRDLVRGCLAALRDRPQGVPFETLLIDNASADGTADMAAAEFPGVVLLRNRVNRGFARAVNQGLRAARGRHLVLLNPDTVPDPGLLGRLVQFLDSSPTVGLCGVQLLHEDGTKQNSIDNDPALVSEIVSKSLLRRLFPRHFPSKRTEFAGPVDVETVIGACIAVRREALEAAGMLDEGYFLFLEETDWCRAMRRAGWRVVHLPGVRLIHLQGKSKDVAPAAVRIEYLRSLFRWFRKNRGAAAWLAVRITRLLRSKIDLASALIACAATGFLVPRLRARLRTVAAMLGWQLLLCPETMGLQSREWLNERAGDDFSADIPPPSIADPDALTSGGDARVLKDVRIKRVIRLRDGDGAWLVKQYREPGWRAFLRGGPRAVREAACAREAALRGVPTLVPPAAGVCPGGSALIHRERPHATALDDFLRRETDRGRRPAAIAADGRLARRTHEAGVHQDDFDPNNALLEWDGAGRPRLLLIDHERVTVRTPLTLAERVWNLAKLHRFPAATGTERRRFLRAYVGRALPGCPGARDLAQWIAAAHRLVLRRDFVRGRRGAGTRDRNIGIADVPEGRRRFRRLRGPDGAAAATEFPREALASPTVGRREVLTPAGRWIVWPVADPGMALGIWAGAQGLLRVRAPVLPLLHLHEDRARGVTLLAALDASDSRPLADALAEADAAGQARLRAALERALKQIDARGAGLPWLTCGAAVFPRLDDLRVAGGEVRFLPTVPAELAEGTVGAEMLAAWREFTRGT